MKIRKGKIVAKCTGSQLDLVARRAPLASMAVRFEVGLSGAPLCMEFGGDVRSDMSEFAARKAPPRSTCLGR